jgi:hypothetical protein
MRNWVSSSFNLLFYSGQKKTGQFVAVSRDFPFQFAMRPFSCSLHSTFYDIPAAFHCQGAQNLSDKPQASGVQLPHRKTPACSFLLSYSFKTAIA